LVGDSTWHLKHSGLVHGLVVVHHCMYLVGLAQVSNYSRY